MKRTRIITAVVLIISIILCSTSASGVTLEQIVEDAEIFFESPISPELKEHLKDAAEDDLIPVAIELKNTADLEKANAEAIQRADVYASEVDMMRMETESLTDEENRVNQSAVLESTDRIRAEKTEVLKEHYTQYNAAFIQKYKIPENRIGFVSRLLPYIGYVLLTPAEIVEISRNSTVENIYYIEPESETTSSVVESHSSVNLATLNEAKEIIGGDVAISQGYTGNGIRVGIVGYGKPDFDLLGTDTENIYLTESAVADSKDIYAAITCKIIKSLAPQCSIYAAAMTVDYDVLVECEALIADYGVHVVNIIVDNNGTGGYDTFSRTLDRLITLYDVSITAATGTNVLESDDVSSFAIGKNVIAVGAVSSQGTNPTAAGAFTFLSHSEYRELGTTVNKPDVCAPGCVSIFDVGIRSSQVSTAFVTGTVVQMMNRNSGLIDKPETIKAAIIASAYHNAGTDRSYVQGTLSSNQEGAGVVDAEFCYWVAANGRRAHFDTVANQYLYTRDVWVDTTSQPFRIACTWRITDENLIDPDDFSNYDIDLVIYKDGVRVAGSGSWASHDTYAVLNYEVIELSPEVLQTYGSGTYHVEIWHLNYTEAVPGLRIGLAWEQPNI